MLPRRAPARRRFLLGALHCSGALVALLGGHLRVAFGLLARRALATLLRGNALGIDVGGGFGRHGIADLRQRLRGRGRSAERAGRRLRRHDRRRCDRRRIVVAAGGVDVGAASTTFGVAAIDAAGTVGATGAVVTPIIGGDGSESRM